MSKGGGGKLLFSLIGFAFGAFDPGFFGMAGNQAWLMGGLYGAALGGSIWTMTHPPSPQGPTYNFDQMMNNTSADSRIPIIYGTRKWGGTQAWYSIASDHKSITKDIVFCEGEIDAFLDIRADDVPFGANTGVNPYSQYTTLNSYYSGLEAQWAATNSTYAGNCSYTTSTGATSQATPSNYTATGGYKNCAWIRCAMNVSDQLQGGNPNITAVIRGRKVLDTRTGITAYSENPAMCTRDYLLSKRFGAGHFVSQSMLDENSFKAVADYCDQWVTTRIPTTLTTSDAIDQQIANLNTYLGHSNLSQTETQNINNEITALQISKININTTPVTYTLQVTPRYSLNMIIAEKKSHVEVLQDIFANFGGFLVFSNNQVGLRCEQATAVSYNFTDDNIIQDSMSYTQYPIEQSANKFSIKWFDPDNFFTGVTITVEDFVDQLTRGKIINKDVQLTGCICQSQALRLGRLFRDKIRLCSIVAQWQTATMAMHLQPGDVVTLTKSIYPNGVHAYLFQNFPVRILEISELRGVYTIKAEQYNDSIYNDSVGAAMQVVNYVQIENPLSCVVPNVTNISTQETFRDIGNGVQVNELEITWSHSDAFYDHAEVYIMSDNPTLTEIAVSWNELDGAWGSIVDSGVWKAVGNLRGYDRVTATNLARGYAYAIKVVAVNSAQRSADFNSAPVASHTVIGKTYQPMQPSGLSLSVTNVCTWQWNQNPDLDIDFYELRSNTNAGNMTGLLAKTQWQTQKTVATPPTRSGTVYLFAHNIAGNYSAPATLTYNQPALAAPASVTTTPIFQGFTTACTALPITAIGINVHINDGTGDKTYFSPNNYYEFRSLGGGYIVSVAYVDQFGEGQQSSTHSVVVTATIDPALIAAQTISISMLDSATAAAVAAGATAETQVSTVVGNLNAAPGSTGYSAITQLNSGIQLKVDKAGVIASINASPEGIAIAGNLIHITGTTLFDNNVIVSNALAAGSVSANAIAANAVSGDKISGGTIDVSKAITLSSPGGGITLDNTGMKMTESTGAYTKLDSNGLNWYNSGGTKYASMRRCVAGTCVNGQHVNLNWDRVPMVILSPSIMQTTIAGYNSSTLQIVCQAQNITAQGFDVVAQTSLLNGTALITVSPATFTAAGQTYQTTTVGNTTSFTVNYGECCGGFSGDNFAHVNGGCEYTIYYQLVGAGSWTQIVHQLYSNTWVAPNARTYTVTGLTAGTYNVKMVLNSFTPNSSGADNYMTNWPSFNSVNCVGGGVLNSTGAVNFLAIEADPSPSYTLS